jgi:hypothetical protein
MASEARSRAAQRAARTRARRHPDGVQRRTARAVELERVERGERTLNEAFGGAPSAHDFLHRAGPYKIKQGKRTLRAFIVPDDARPSPRGVLVYWYARGVDPPRTGERYDTPGGTFQLVSPLEAPRARLGGGRTYERACTGYGYFHVNLHGSRSDA